MWRIIRILPLVLGVGLLALAAVTRLWGPRLPSFADLADGQWAAPPLTRAWPPGPPGE